MDNTEFIIFVTGKYHWLIQPLLYFYKKYMPVPLTFFSDRLIDGQNVIEVFPKDMRVYWEPCGKLIKDALKKVNKPIVVFGYMDLLPIRPVDLRLLGIFEQFMIRNKTAARGNLWAGADKGVQSCRDYVQAGTGYSIRRLPKEDPEIASIGTTSLLPAIWRTDFLLDFIEDDWSLDAIESKGPAKFIYQSKWYSVAMLPGLFDPCHLCYTADQSEVRLSTIPDAEDRAFVSQFVPIGSRIT